MSWKQKTGAFIIAVVLIGTIYDIYAYVGGGTEATISWYIYAASYKHPSIPFVFGYVCGHFFWQMKGLQKLKLSESKASE